MRKLEMVSIWLNTLRIIKKLTQGLLIGPIIDPAENNMHPTRRRRRSATMRSRRDFENLWARSHVRLLRALHRRAMR